MLRAWLEGDVTGAECAARRGPRGDGSIPMVESWLLARQTRPSLSPQNGVGMDRVRLLLYTDFSPPTYRNSVWRIG